MPDWLIIVLIVLAVLVVGFLIWSAAKKGRAKQIERQREESLGHRQEAQTAAQRAGEADLAARRAAEEAERERERALELERKATEVDPDHPNTPR